MDNSSAGSEQTYQGEGIDDSTDTSGNNSDDSTSDSSSGDTSSGDNDSGDTWGKYSGDLASGDSTDSGS
jgi:hypothetical protein